MITSNEVLAIYLEWDTEAKLMIEELDKLREEINTAQDRYRFFNRYTRLDRLRSLLKTERARRREFDARLYRTNDDGS